jgi:hypothetical protein
MTNESDANDAIRAAIESLTHAIEMSERVVYGSQVLVPLRDALRETRYALDIAEGRG